MSRSDEEILDEVDLRLAYRIGWPEPLPVLPVRLTRIFDEAEFISDFEDVKRAIRTICDSERVH